MEFVVRERRVVIYYVRISMLLHTPGHVFQCLAFIRYKIFLQLNLARCDKSLKISGIYACVDMLENASILLLYQTTRCHMTEKHNLGSHAVLNA